MPAANKLVLGTVQFGLNYGINNNSGKPDQSTVNNILDHAFTNGIDMLDTAEAYGDSHEAIGRYHSHSKNRFKVITKFGSNRTDLPNDLVSRVEKDLETIGAESLYGYMFHSFGDFTKHFPSYGSEIKLLKQKGLVLNFGVSVYTNEEALSVLTSGEVDFIQLPFNLLDNTSQRGEVLSLAKQKNVEVHVRSAFLQGLFFKNVTEIPAGLEPLTPYLKQIKNIATSASMDLATLSLSYPLQQTSIDRVLIGVDTVEQLKQNMDSIVELDKDLVDEIDSICVGDPTLLNPSTWKRS